MGNKTLSTLWTVLGILCLFGAALILINGRSPIGLIVAIVGCGFLLIADHGSEP